MRWQTRCICAVDSDRIEQGAHACAVESDLAYDAGFRDLDNGGLVSLGDPGDYQILFLLGHPLHHLSVFRLVLSRDKHARPSSGHATRASQCATPAPYTHH